METVKKFLTEIANDRIFANQLVATNNKEEFFQVSKERGYNFTEQHMFDLKKVANLIRQSYSGEPLNDADLALVAGGRDWFKEGLDEFNKVLQKISDFQDSIFK